MLVGLLVLVGAPCWPAGHGCARPGRPPWSTPRRRRRAAWAALSGLARLIDLLAGPSAHPVALGVLLGAAVRMDQAAGGVRCAN
jgi:hypothetical protein